MSLLAINWAVVGIKAAQLILSLSILVVLHEFGHYITAKIFKCRVEKFYLFFNPWFSIAKKKIGETEYGIGWVPLGGYVKIAGMIDESMDKEQMALPPEPYEFRSKPAWQRLIIMLGGIMVNVLLGFFIYAMMLWHWGESYLPVQNVKYGIVADSLAQSVGLKSGDKIVAVDGEKLQRFDNEHLLNIIINKASSIEVERNGAEHTIALPADLSAKVINKHLHFLNEGDLRIPMQPLSSIVDTSVAKKAGFQKDDKIIAINNQPVAFWDEFTSAVKQNKNRQIVITVLRNADTAKLSLTVPAEGIIGVAMDTKNLDKIFQFDTIHYSFFQALPAGVSKGCRMLVSYVQQMKLLFGPGVNLSEGLSGPIGIANLFPATWQWQTFWSFTAFLSMILAIMNLLPIPALDGGHALFCIYEMITGRKPNDKFMEYAQVVGMIILLALMVFAFGNDIFRLFKK